MSDGIEARASKVVDLFKQESSKTAQQSLTQSDYDRLAALVKSALSAQREETIQQLEEYIRKLRTEIQYRDLE